MAIFSHARTSNTPDRRAGSYISRQNDPAYNREVQYTYRELTYAYWTDNQCTEIIRSLCKDQGLNIPFMQETVEPDLLSLTYKELNNRVDYFMSLATPANKSI